MMRRMPSRPTGFALALALGFAGACTGSAQTGHATYFTCHEGRIESVHVPLDQAPKLAEFQECDEGRCVPVGESCPEPLAKTAGACAADTDCAWDDDCVPVECVTSTPDAVPADCDETAPPPGDCRCVNQRCAVVKPKTPLPSAP